jgi:hypothetical protein
LQRNDEKRNAAAGWFRGEAMKRLAILALSLGLLAGYGSAQDSGSGAKEKQDPTPTPAQLEEMKKTLEAQQKEIERLKQEALEGDKALENMQKQVQEQQQKVQDQLKQAEEAASAANAAAAKATEASKTQPAAQRQAPDDMNLDKPGVVKATLSKSFEAMLQQPNPATGVVTPPWAVLKISDNVMFRFGTLIQPQYEALQDQVSTGYSQSFYLRRARFNVLANLPENITVFFQTDDIRVGYSNPSGTKPINTGFQLLDGWAQWNFLGKAMALQAGFFLVPSDRQIMMNAATFLAVDLMSWPTQMSTILEESGGRDYGVGLNGALLDDHLTYRAGVYEGYRQPAVPPAAGSRNSLLFGGRVEYDVFDPQLSYAYTGTYLGKKKVLGVAGWWQAQNDYKAYGGDVFWDWPVMEGDAVTFEADYVHYDGHGQVFNDNGTLNTLPEQYTLYTNAGYYFCKLKLQPFVRYEFLKYTDDVINLAKGQQHAGVGFNYYVYGYNFKISPMYERIFPRGEPVGHQVLEDYNRFVVQLQGSF